LTAEFLRKLVAEFNLYSVALGDRMPIEWREELGNVGQSKRLG
jgi:hypothetical protein